MKPRFTVVPLTLILATLPGASFWPRLNAQQPDPGKYSTAEHELVEFRNEMVPMRDGAKLAIDIFRPEGEGRYPVVPDRVLASYRQRLSEGASYSCRNIQ